MKKKLHEKIFVLCLGLIVLNSVYSLFAKFYLASMFTGLLFALLAYGILNKKKIAWLLSSATFFILSAIAMSSLDYTTVITQIMSICYLLIAVWFMSYSLAVYAKMSMIKYTKTLVWVNSVLGFVGVSNLGIYIVMLGSGVSQMPDFIMPLIIEDIIALLILVLGAIFWSKTKK